MRRMRSESMPPQSMAIAPPTRVERAEMPLAEKSVSDGGRRHTVRRRRAVMSAGQTEHHGARGVDRRARGRPRGAEVEKTA